MRALVPHKLLFAVIRGEHLRLMALFHKYRAVFGIEDLDCFPQELLTSHKLFGSPSLLVSLVLDQAG